MSECKEYESEKKKAYADLCPALPQADLSVSAVYSCRRYVRGRKDQRNGRFFWRTEKGILVAWCDLAGVRCGNGLQVLSVKA